MKNEKQSSASGKAYNKLFFTSFAICILFLMGLFSGAMVQDSGRIDWPQFFLLLSLVSLMSGIASLISLHFIKGKIAAVFAAMLICLLFVAIIPLLL